MIQHAILHDTRLGGRASGSRQGYRLYRTNGNISLNWTLNHVKNDAVENGGIDTLHIYCHGYAGENEAARVCGDFGGQGLELGREAVTLHNVEVMKLLKGCANKIIIHACAAADSTWAHLDMYSDGQLLMRRIALNSGAYVTAADRIQWYQENSQIPDGRIDFGSWEGNVFMFPPTGGSPILVAS